MRVLTVIAIIALMYFIYRYYKTGVIGISSGGFFAG